MDVRSCPVCSTTFGPDWSTLSRLAAGGEPVATHVCPECTLAWTGRPQFRVDTCYRSRVWSRDAGGLLESGDGRVTAGPPEHRADLAAARVSDLRRAFAAVRTRRRVRVLQVGLSAGPVVHEAGRGLRVNAMALEPWAPWANAARAHATEVHQQTLESWRRRGMFDVIVEHDLLPHLCEPLQHLRTIAGRLAPAGVALIEVPNLLRAAGLSDEEVLSTARPFWFTPRALVTACKRAGLTPFHLAADERLRVLCRVAPPLAMTVPGVLASEVVDVVRGNDTRLLLKRALFRTGATPSALQMAAIVHARCTRRAVRADLAIEIATACERTSNFEAAAHWLEVSMLDRPDPEVAQTLATLELLRRRVRSLWLDAPAANDPMPSGTARLAS